MKTTQVRIRQTYRRLPGEMDRVLTALARGPEQIQVAVGSAIAKGAQVRAPKRTGYLASSITDDGAGTVTVGAYYGVYVNFGTRYMAAQPFFSQACGIDGVKEMGRQLAGLVGHGTGIPQAVQTQVDTFRTGGGRVGGFKSATATVRRNTTTRAKRVRRTPGGRRR